MEIPGVVKNTVKKAFLDPVKCRDCYGKGTVKCKRCSGQGKLGFPRVVCKLCSGSGKVKCSRCNGKGWLDP